MTLQECESKLIALVDEMRSVYREYHPEDERLWVSVNDGEVMITCYGMKDGSANVTDRVIDVFRYRDGRMLDTKYSTALRHGGDE